MTPDSQLQEAVLAELSWEPSVVAAHIGVTANQGVVTLSGQVGTFAQKRAAESAASRVKGVKALAEELEVNLPFEMKRDDGDIALAAIDRLAWDTSVPRDSVVVKADNGWITLTGEVDWHFQKDAAEQDIRHLMGVVGLSNQITIRAQVNAVDIGNEITRALHRSWLDPKTITVRAQGGDVKLTGTAHSWHERQIAGDTAWSARGTTDVENDIIIV
ncbi:BON domain-containing protein [Acidisoma sp. L85]|uniref:BON domain-containing protein n=1 Tax=Acidisoma sp. L85 TaxID=1641850 RepID=UPI00131DB16C|nr:BON domain-containing protein [Acidisoma sp. L85]